MVSTVSPCRRAMLAWVWRRSCRRTPRNPASARTVSQNPSSQPLFLGPWPRAAGNTHCPVRSSPSRMFRAGRDSQTVRGPSLAVAEEEVTLAVVGPAECQDLALAASRQQEEPDDGDLLRTPICVGRQSRGQAAYLLVGQEARASLAAVASDAQAGVGALGPKTHGFRLPQDDGEHRHGAVGGDRGRAQRCEPVPDVPAVDVGDLSSLEAGQDLVLQVAPVDIERSRLPEPPVSFENGLGDGLEEGLGGIAGRVLSTSDRGESSHGTSTVLRPRS